MDSRFAMRNEFVKAARDLRKYAKDVQKAIEKANQRTAKAGLKEAVKSSSGTTTLAQLRKEGHPYAVRWSTMYHAPGTRVYRNPAIINSQSGDFVRDWKIVYNVKTREPIIINFSEVAGFLEGGTKKMFARPIEDRIIAAMSKVGIDNLDREVQKIR